jgi:hypothetical protein
MVDLVLVTVQVEILVDPVMGMVESEEAGAAAVEASLEEA